MERGMRRDAGRRWLGKVLMHTGLWTFVYSSYAFLVLLDQMGNGTRSPELGQFWWQFGMAFPWVLFGSALFGIFLGSIDHFSGLRTLRSQPFALVVLTRFVVSFLALLLGCAIPILTGIVLNNFGGGMAGLIFYLPRTVAIIYLALIVLLLLSFFQQASKNIGTETTLRILSGRYHQPRTEEWAFMFLDMKDSTRIAEATGHARFASLIQELFHEVNALAARHGVEIYKYVGDEVILCWKGSRAKPGLQAAQLFFAFQERIGRLGEGLRARYGLVPEFKASAHAGEVTVAEVGDIKREIAFFGDVVNTTSRIESCCTELDEAFLLSEELFQSIAPGELARLGLRANAHPGIALKGKQGTVTLYGLQRAG